VRDSPGNSWETPQGSELEPRILALAQRQHGHIARRQLLALGLSRGAIEARLKSGVYIAVHRGVYGIAPRRNDPVSRAAAAVLVCGDGAALSHASAASLWGFVAHWHFPLEVMAGGERDRPGILTHRCQSLQHEDITHQRGIRVTSPARTVLDCAPELGTKARTRLINDALRSRHLRPAALQDILQRNRYHPGTKLLTPFADDPNNPTNSDFEDDFLAFTAKYGLPTPQINVQVSGRQADAFFPEHNLIVECDGWEFHKDRDAFEDDRERDAENLKHGIRTVRITKRRLTLTPDREAARLQEILQADPARSGPS
jgi:hypothetical protein